MLRNQTAIRLIFLLSGVVVLIICVAAVSFVHKGITPEPQAAKPARFKLAWQAGVGRVVDASLSSNGRFFSTVTPAGTVLVYSTDNRRMYSCDVTGATRAIVADDGRYMMAYSAMDPVDRTLTFIESTGCPYWEVELPAAAWCADATSENGISRFAVGTGDGYVYVLEVGKNRRRYHRWRAPGAVTSIALSSKGREVVIGTWQKSGVCKASIRGRRIWQVDAEPSDLQEVEALWRSGKTLARGVPNRAGEDGEYVIVDREGEIICRGEISARQSTRVIASPGGEFLCVGREELINHKGKSMRTKRAVLLDCRGAKKAETGSLFLQADPIMLTRGGTALIGNEKGTLFAMSPSGKLDVALRLPGPVERSSCSDDGSKLLVIGGGTMSIVNVLD